MKNVIEKLLENKKLLCGGIAVLLILVIGLVLLFNNKTLTYAKEEILVKGFENKEEIKIKYSFGKIKKITLNQEINLIDDAKGENVYLDAIENTLNISYEYGKPKISKKDNKLEMILNLNKNGMILNSLSISRGEEENSSIRFDSLNYKDDNGVKINVGDKIKVDKLDKLMKDNSYNRK